MYFSQGGHLVEFDFFLTLQKVLVLFLLIVIGFIAGRRNLISKQGQKDLTNVVLYITMPATIFVAMQLEFTWERIQTAQSILIITVVCYLFIFILGKLLTSWMKVDLAKKDLIHTALLLSNTSFMGYPIIQSLLGNQALFYAVIGTGIVFEVVSWTLGLYLIGRNSDTQSDINLRKIILSPGILATAFGLIFFLGQRSVPEPVHSVLHSLSPATSPLAMIVVGLILSRSNVSEVFKNKSLYFISLIKLLLVPITIVSVLKLLGVSGMNLVIPTMMLSTPTASYVAMFAANTENNPKLASQIVFMTSLLSIITIPVITLFF